MGPAEQLPFDLGHREAFARDDFWVSDSNRDAVAWLDKWPGWPAPALVIYGPPGCGKTHLCHVFQRQAGAGAVIIDDADRRAGDRAAEEDLFHLYNRFTDGSGHILLTASRPVKEWAFALPDLKSRLLAAPAVAVSMPDDQLMAVVLSKLFSDRQLYVPQEVVQFIVARSERSFAALRDLARGIDRKAMAEKRAVTIPLVRDLLQGK